MKFRAQYNGVAFVMLVYGSLSLGVFVPVLPNIVQYWTSWPTQPGLTTFFFADSPIASTTKAIANLAIVVTALNVLRRPTDSLFPLWFGFGCAAVGELAFLAVRIAMYNAFAPNGMLFPLTLLSNFIIPGTWLAALLVLRSAKKLQLQKAKGYAHCSRCQYSMRGLTHPKCPECGAAYELDEFYHL